METTMGCPDDVLLSIAEIATLAHWKAESIRSGTFSYMELNRRALEIQAFLHDGAGIHAEEEACQRKLEDDRQSLTRRLFLPNVGIPPTLPPQNVAFAAAFGAASATSSTNSSAGSSGARSRSNSPPGPGAATPTATSPYPHSARPDGLDDLQIQSLAAQVFRQGAHLYLQSVVSEANPVLLAACVRRVMLTAIQLPASDVDKSLIFPLCLAGCLSEDQTEREFFRSRLLPHKTVGNCTQAVRLMEAIWTKKAQAIMTGMSGIAVDWRQTMEEMGVQLLLV